MGTWSRSGLYDQAVGDFEGLDEVIKELTEARNGRGQLLNEFGRQLHACFGDEAVTLSPYDEEEQDGYLRVKLAEGEEWTAHLIRDQSYCNVTGRQSGTAFPLWLNQLGQRLREIRDSVASERQALASALSNLDQTLPADLSAPIGHLSRPSSLSDADD